LDEVLEQLESDADAKVLVVWGGDKVFCAGADVKDMQAALEAGRNPGPEIVAHFRPVIDRLAAFPRPTFAAIVRFALGGGLELALACDFRIAADDARLGQPEIQLGIIPGAGGTQRLPRLIGPARAKWMIMSGRPVTAAEAVQWGLVDAAVPPAEVLEQTLTRARELARGAVVAMGLAKRAVDGGIDLPLDNGLDLENRLFADVYDTDDATAGVASFVAQGPGTAEFKGR
jgi:enoyl-CoA hydratase/carnithine racemase